MRVCLVMSAAIAALLLPSSAGATDGHFLHGVGAVNASLGGIGIARSPSVLGAMYVNPAGLMAFRGTQMEMGFEMFKADRTISSAAGPMSGSTTSSSEWMPVPAFGWSREVAADRLVLAVGGLGIGGFGVDYRTDPSNPITMPAPYGFGQIYSNFSLMKVLAAAAYKVAPSVTLGAALNVNWASLAVDPMPIGAPAIDPGPDATPMTADDRAYYSSATDADGAFGVGAQLGLQWQVTNRLAVGLAYTSPQVFEKFQYDAVYENPNLPNYGTPRTIEFAMDVPAIYGVGVAVMPTSALMLGVDAKYIMYGSTRGFEESGFAADGSVKGFGWENILVLATGLEYKAAPKVALRGGYNYSGNPIPENLMMFNAPAPAIVQHHATFGIGYQFSNGFGVDLGYYRVFENSLSGPFQTMAGPAAGTSVTSTMSEQSIQIGFTFRGQ